jgi:magnesium transporter
MAVVDNAVYVDGHRLAMPHNLDETYRVLRSSGGMAWIGLYRPDLREIQSVADEFGLHPLAVEDAVVAHQRPKLERYGDVLFTVLRPARYVDAEEEVEFGELHVFIGPDFVLTVRHAETPDLHKVRERLENHPELLCHGPEAVLYAILDQVVDEYGPVLAGLENDIDEIEDELFAGEPGTPRRIYELSREVIALQRATKPLLTVLHSLELGFDKYGIDVELRRSLRDVQDHAINVVERADGFRSLLQNALSLQSTLIAQQQNEEMRAMTETSLAQNEEVKKISAWAAIFFAPTLVGTIYGMNFRHMPELSWAGGYAYAIGLMVVLSFALWLAFRRRNWL